MRQNGEYGTARQQSNKQFIPRLATGYDLRPTHAALVAIITLSIAILLSFIPLCGLGLTSNIMSLGGIAIAIGAMIDAAIIMVENAQKALEHFKEQHGQDPGGRERFALIVGAAKSVGRPLDSVQPTRGLMPNPYAIDNQAFRRSFQPALLLRAQSSS